MEWERADAEFKRLVGEVEAAPISVAMKEKVLRLIALEQLVAGFEYPEWGKTLERALVFFRQMHEEAMHEDPKVPRWNDDIQNAWWNNAVVEAFFAAGKANQLERSLHVRTVWNENMRKACFSILARGDMELPATVTEYGQRAMALRERAQFVVMVTAERLPAEFARQVRGGNEPAKRTIR